MLLGVGSIKNKSSATHFGTTNVTTRHIMGCGGQELRFKSPGGSFTHIYT